MYAHYYTITRKFTKTERERIFNEVEQFLLARSPEIKSYSSGGYYKYYPVDFSTIQLDTEKIHLEVIRPTSYFYKLKYEGHLGDNLIIDLKNPKLNVKTQINTLRLPFDTIVQSIFIIINNIAPDAFMYSSDGTVDDWKWSRNTLNRLTDKKYTLSYLDDARVDTEKEYAISEVLDSSNFSYVDGKRFINNDGDIYEVLNSDELYHACVNHIAEVVPTYLLSNVDVDGFYNEMVKRMYDGSEVHLSPVGCGFVTEIDGKEYFIIKK